MKINKIKINSFGKLKEKEINLENGINLIQGKNETGKTTLLKFITSSFYGISKNKKGKEYSDFEKYTPWVGEEFSGKLEYELDNKNKYEIYRDFKKKNPKIFNDKMEDVSKEFTIDKATGNQFFYDQTKVDEPLFMSTVVAEQQEVKLGKQEQSVLVQKIANLVGTGDDNVSFKRAVDRINRRQLDEVGTLRSREKPINIINKKIEELENEKSYLKKYKNEKYEIEENKNKINNEIKYLENKNNLLNEIKKINDEKNIENEKIKIKENIKKENIEKINLIKNKLNKIKIENKNILENNSEKNKKIKNKLNKKIILFLIILIIINILQFIFIKNKLINYIFLLTVPTYLIYLIILKNKLINKNKKEEKNKLINLEKIKIEINNYENEINLIEKNNDNLENEINNLKNSLILKINFEKEKIKNNYLNKLSKKENNYFNKIEENNYLKKTSEKYYTEIKEEEINKIINLENVNYEIEKIQKEINNKKLELHSLELDRRNIEPQLDNLAKIDEELVNNKQMMSTLQKNNMSFELAKSVLEKAYQEMRNTVTPKFTQELSKNISEITNGKYCNVNLNDEQGLIVELENGNYVPASKLSVGTIDQLYLSLRLSMVKELSDENMPIILDEAFAYYDTERLKNILKYINDKFEKNQVIIFTCTNREEEILEELKIKFNKIKLNY